MEKRNKELANTAAVFYDEAEEESWKRYKLACYRNLILKSLLTFLLGLFLAVLLKL